MTTASIAAQAEPAPLRALIVESAPAKVALAGVVFGVSSLRIWGMEMGWIAWPEALRPLLGWDALIVQVALTPVVYWLVAHGGPRLSVANTGDRAVLAAVTAFAWAFGAAMVGLAFAASRMEAPTLVLGVFPIVLFALNAAAWWVAFSVYGRLWALAGVLGSVATTLGLGLVAGTTSQWLILGLGMIAWLTGPALALARHPGASAARRPETVGAAAESRPVT